MKKLMIKWIGEYKAKVCFGVSARTRALHARAGLLATSSGILALAPILLNFHPMPLTGV